VRITSKQSTNTSLLLIQFIFDWDNAPIKPEAYDANIEVNLAAFAEPDSGLTNVNKKGKAWRTRVQLSSIASKVGDE